jgi:hypothetical protein
MCCPRFSIEFDAHVEESYVDVLFGETETEEES